MQFGPAITSRSNARVKALRASLSGKASRPGELLGLEGPNLIREAHMAGMSFDTVYVREGSEAVLSAFLRPGESLRSGNWALLSRDVFDGAVSTEAPQGIAATWILREPQEPFQVSGVGLILENLQDPGNMGTLIRSASAFGMGGVVATLESVNPWSPKVVRASAGTLFRTPVRRMPLANVVAELRTAGVRVFAAVSGFPASPEEGTPIMAAPHGVLTGRVNNFEATEPRYSFGEEQDRSEREASHGYPASFSYDTDFIEPCAILIGNEGAGLSPEARRLADEQVIIPCNVNR